MKNILITGGAGFVGSSIALELRNEYSQLRIIAFDNLKRLGSEQNIARLKKAGIEFMHGDVRNIEDIASVGEFDTLLECSAEPSVLAGYSSNPARYLINTNLIGLINCLEFAKLYQADVIFLSTSRVYPARSINSAIMDESETRYILCERQSIPGISSRGISEAFPLGGVRSLYGATKLSGEYFLDEYADAYKIRGIVNRCGVIAGPWQMGKIDQGFMALWIARHVYGKELNYIGYDGQGKQVRDVIHVKDLFRLLNIQLKNMDQYKGQIFNVGGGLERSISLQELTALCSNITKKKVDIGRIKETRPHDIKIYITDISKVREATGWVPRKSLESIVEDIYRWIRENEMNLEYVLS
jgi:CDP-paratose 2-epimerase